MSTKKFKIAFTIFISFPFGFYSVMTRDHVFSVKTLSIFIYLLQPHIIAKDNGAKNTKYTTRRFIMLSFLKKIFGAKPAAESTAPYKVESSEHFPFPKQEKPAKKPAAKKSADKKPAAKKPAKKTNKPV